MTESPLKKALFQHLAGDEAKQGASTIDDSAEDKVDMQDASLMKRKSRIYTTENIDCSVEFKQEVDR